MLFTIFQFLLQNCRMNLPFQTIVSGFPVEVLLSSLVFVLTLVVIQIRGRMKYQLPPGPKGWPILGIFFDIYDYPAHLAYTEWSKKHGKIFTISVIGRKCVILNDAKTIREAMLNCSPKIDDKTDWRYCFIELLKGLSVMPYSKKWQNTRRRTAAILKELGMGKSFLEPEIYDETRALVANLLHHSENGKTNITIKDRIRRTPINLICSMLYNERYDYDDDSLNFILETMEYLLTFLRAASTYDALPNILRPLMSHTLRDFHAHIKLLNDFLQSKVQYHEETYKDGVQRDFVDAWIKYRRMNLKKNQSQNVEGVSQEANGTSAGTSLSTNEDSCSPVVNVLQDVLFAGAHSTGYVLNWLIMLLTMHKDVQDEVFNAIAEVLGTDRRPTVADRSQLPIVEAVIYETLRISTIVPLVGHACYTDVTLCGYHLPKKTEVTYNNWAVNFDEENFPNAKSFIPHRWLLPDGTFDRESTNKFFPFGLGKRGCAGETLAKAELFIITTTLYQSCEFLMPDGDVGSKHMPEIKHIQSFVLEPKPYMVRVKRRSEVNSKNVEIPSQP
ncbi:cytochrome P450 1A1-like [Styela clava]